MSPETFAQTVLPMRDKLYRLALRITGNAHDAEDALQEVMIKLWRQGETLSAIQNLEAWSLRVCRNHCIDRLRNRGQDTQGFPEHYEAVSPDDTPDRKTEQRDLLRRIRQCIDKLPEKYRLVFHLREIEGLSYQEIEEALEMPMQQVKVNLFRARQLMREHIQTLQKL